MVKMFEPFNSTPHMECGGFSFLCTIAGKATPEVEVWGFFCIGALGEHAATEQDRDRMGIDPVVFWLLLSSATDTSPPTLMHHERPLSN